jgi:queuine tRNA-ribosyltransferase
MQFRIIKKSTKSLARLGMLETSHGTVETPAFVPVATNAVVKTLSAEEVEQTKSQLLICNTYHLHVRPGEEIVKKNKGLHNFMNWKKPLMTDSGGFQVFSLGFGRDLGTGKILNEKKEKFYEIEKGQQPKLLKITEDGVHFRSYIDGKEMFLSPKESIKIQEKLGADIIFNFDECTSPLANHDYTKKSLEKTHRWAQICLKTKKNNKQALYGIVQGGKFKDLRTESAQFMGYLPFDGFGIGGEFGDDKTKMSQMLGWVIKELPELKPRHLLGIGHLDDVVKIIKSGIDTFDCITPTHYARRGYVFTSEGKLFMGKQDFLKDKNPLDKKCSCKVCQNYTRSYISHLFHAAELTALQLMTFHNLYYFNDYVEKVRRQIKEGRL